MQLFLTILTVATWLAFQAFDWGGTLGPVLTFALALFTIYSQIQSRKLVKRVEDSESAHKHTKELFEAWKNVVESEQKRGDALGVEVVELRSRLRQQERHTSFAEKGQYKLVIMLMKAGVDIDVDQLFADLHYHDEHQQHDVHSTADSALTTHSTLPPEPTQEKE